MTEYQPHWAYRVLIDNDVAIVAAGGEGINLKDIHSNLPPYPKPVIELDTLAIDRKTGDAIKGYVTLYVSHPDKPPARGTCHEQTADDPGAIWPRGMKGNDAVPSKKPN